MTVINVTVKLGQEIAAQYVPWVCTHTAWRVQAFLSDESGLHGRPLKNKYRNRKHEVDGDSPAIARQNLMVVSPFLVMLFLDLWVLL